MTELIFADFLEEQGYNVDDLRDLEPVQVVFTKVFDFRGYIPRRGDGSGFSDGDGLGGAAVSYLYGGGGFSYGWPNGDGYSYGDGFCNGEGYGYKIGGINGDGYD